MSKRERVRRAAIAVFSVASLAFAAACFTSPDGSNRFGAKLSRDQEMDSLRTWRMTLPYPHCRVAVGQVAFFEPFERAAGVRVTLSDSTRRFSAVTNRNGQFRMEIDTGTFTLTATHGSAELFRGTIHRLDASNSAVFTLSAKRDGHGTLYTETSGCARPPGYVDTLISEKKR